MADGNSIAVRLRMLSGTISSISAVRLEVPIASSMSCSSGDERPIWRAAKEPSSIDLFAE
jgi:hypothetical protein